MTTREDIRVTSATRTILDAAEKTVMRSSEDSEALMHEPWSRTAGAIQTLRAAGWKDCAGPDMLQVVA